MDAGEDVAIKTQSVRHFEGPATANDVEKRGSRGVGNLGGEFTGQLETDVVLREQHLAHSIEVLGLVVSHPEQLGKSEAGQDWVGDRFENLLLANRRVDEI